MKYIIIGIFLLLLTGCNSGAKKTIETEETNIITLASIDEIQTDTAGFLQKQKAVILETIDSDSKSSLIAEITKIATDDAFLFIWDKTQKKILIFDIEGKFINQIHCVGQGPKEYVEITNFTVDPVEKQLIILSSIPTKNMYFSYTGEFIKEENNPEHYMGVEKENEYMYFERPSYPKIEKDSYQFTIKNSMDNSQKSELLQVPNIRSYAYNNGFALTKGKTKIYYTRRFDNSIYQFNQGRVEKMYRVDFKKHNAPEDLKLEEDEVKLLNYCRTNNLIFSMTDVVNSDRFLLFFTDWITFVYDKPTDVLKGYKKLICSQSDHIPLDKYLPIENSNKIAYSVYPIYIYLSVSHQDSEEIDTELLKISKEIDKDNNPILFIYELL